MKSTWNPIPLLEYGDQDRAFYLSDTGLRLLTLKENNYAPKDGKDIGCYRCQHENGFAMLYVNKTTNKSMTELIKFDLEGMTIESTGEKQGIIEAKVGPGEEKLIKLNRIKGSTDFKLGVATGKTTITEI